MSTWSTASGEHPALGPGHESAERRDDVGPRQAQRIRWIMFGGHRYERSDRTLRTIGAPGLTTSDKKASRWEATAIRVNTDALCIRDHPWFVPLFACSHSSQYGPMEKLSHAKPSSTRWAEYQVVDKLTFQK